LIPKASASYTFQYATSKSYSDHTANGVLEVAQDGYFSRLVRVRDLYNADLFSNADLLHPAQMGHMQIADAFLREIVPTGIRGRRGVMARQYFGKHGQIP
jgi:hypothetical protein